VVASLTIQSRGCKDHTAYGHPWVALLHIVTHEQWRYLPHRWAMTPQSCTRSGNMTGYSAVRLPSAVMTCQHHMCLRSIGTGLTNQVYKKIHFGRESLVTMMQLQIILRYCTRRVGWLVQASPADKAIFGVMRCKHVVHLHHLHRMGTKPQY
jgi:hypothetical protein